MATTTTPPTTPAPAPGRDERKVRVRPHGGFELRAWVFMRLSGLLLLFLALGHLFVMHIVETGAERIDFGFVALRWESLFWRVWDWLLLVLALLHGVNGLRNITLDYVRPPKARAAINVLSYAIGLALMILGTVIVVTFDAAKWPGATGG